MMNHLSKMWFQYLKCAVIIFVFTMVCLSSGEPIWEEYWNRPLAQVRLADAFFLMMILLWLHSMWVKDSQEK